MKITEGEIVNDDLVGTMLLDPPLIRSPATAEITLKSPAAHKWANDCMVARDLLHRDGRTWVITGIKPSGAGIHVRMTEIRLLKHVHH